MSIDREPLVSILIPAYNAERYLNQCLDSIIYQTYRNLQIIVIDDGSKDNTWKICQEYLAKDKRLEIYHQTNCGVAKTRNHLLQKVNGDYVLFVDADDWMEPDMIDYLVSKNASNYYDVITCGCVTNNHLEPSILTVEETWNQEKYVYEYLRHTVISGSLWNKLIRAELLSNESFREDVSYGEDALFIWHVIQKVDTVLVSNKQLYHHRVDNNDSISHLSWSPNIKGTGSIVWQTITNDAKVLWPQYLDIAKARYAIEDMWGLYYASLAQYSYDEHIRQRQLNVRRHLGLIRRSGLINKKKIIACYVLAYCYKAGLLLKQK